MTDDDDVTGSALEKVPTGLPGLDTILNGGFFRGGVYMVQAPPGSGKTILGNQICFRHVAAGGRALVVTLLTESHSRLIAQLRTLSFFDSGRVGAELSYVTGYQALEKEKLKGLLALLRQIVRDHQATFLMIDGLVTAGAMAESEIETKKFIHELQVFAELVGCTTLLLTGSTLKDEQYALRTMVDGLIELQLDSIGMEAARTIAVSKFRGSAVLLGRHLFEITGDGLTIYPRTEAAHRPVRALDPGASPGLATFGVAGLDELLGSGMRPGSIAMVLGAPGSGKTLLGLSFLVTGANAGAPGLYFGFFESPAELTRKGGAIGLGVEDELASGQLHLMWHSPLDVLADVLAEKLLTTLRERNIRRLFIDGLGGFRDTLVYPSRARRFFGALFDQLRALGVVTVLSDDTRTLGDIEVPERGLSAMLDSVIALRHVDADARPHKVVSVVKLRERGGPSSAREIAIDARGIHVEGETRKAPGGGASRRNATSRPAKKASKRKRLRR